MWLWSVTFSGLSKDSMTYTGTTKLYKYADGTKASYPSSYSKTISPYYFEEYNETEAMAQVIGTNYAEIIEGS